MKVFIISLVLFLHLSIQINGQTLHSIIIADTIDKTIGMGCKQDVSNILIEISNIARYNNFDTNNLILQGNAFQTDSIYSAINQLEVIESRDIIILYYSGHGTNTRKHPSEYPLIQLADGNIAFESLHNNLKEKGAKLLVSVSDCCNKLISDVEYEQRVVKIIPQEKNKKHNYKNLFWETEGDIIISSCKKGQLAYSLPDKGGCFTMQFIESLAIGVNYSMHLTWEDLLKKVSSKMKMIKFVGNNQSPVYQINENRKTSTPE